MSFIQESDVIHQYVVNVISTHLTRYFISKLSPSLAYLNVMYNCSGNSGIDVAPADPIALGAPPGVHSTKS